MRPTNMVVRRDKIKTISGTMRGTGRPKKILAENYK